MNSFPSAHFFRFVELVMPEMLRPVFLCAEKKG